MSRSKCSQSKQTRCLKPDILRADKKKVYIKLGSLINQLRINKWAGEQTKGDQEPRKDQQPI